MGVALTDIIITNGKTFNNIQKLTTVSSTQKLHNI